MRLLILGGDGMLGHQLLSSLNSRHQVVVTLRQQPDAYSAFPIFNQDNAHFGIDVRDHLLLRKVIEKSNPEFVINAVGIVKQRPVAKEAIASLEINSLLPHRITEIAVPIGARVL